MTPAEAAEQSRIATAEGMREMAAALNERATLNCSPVTSIDSDDSYDSSDSSDSSNLRRRKRARKSKRNASGSSEHEKRSHYLQLELANARVDVDDLKAELAKLKESLDPYSVINNELSYIKSAIDRSNKELDTLTLPQLEKRATLYADEYKEHISLCNVAVNKLPLAEVKNSFARVLVAERKRAIKAEDSISRTIWIRKVTYKVSFGFALSVLVALVSWFFYWQLVFLMRRLF